MSERPTKRELTRVYRRAGSVAGVAAELGVAYETARRRLLEAGVALRGQGRPSPGAGSVPVETIIERYRAGESFAAIASDLNVSPNTVRNRLMAAGGPLRPRPGWKY